MASRKWYDKCLLLSCTSEMRESKRGRKIFNLKRHKKCIDGKREKNVCRFKVTCKACTKGAVIVKDTVVIKNKLHVLRW